MAAVISSISSGVLGDDMKVHSSKKLVISKSGVRIVPTEKDGWSPFVIKEPLWVPDKEISHCGKCAAKFSFTNRKHHCRRCGNIFCNECCATKLLLPRMSFVDPVRVCLDCQPETKMENRFFERQLKVLLNGALFDVTYADSLKPVSQVCKLSLDHRYLLFDKLEVSPIKLNQVTNLVVSENQETGLPCVFIECESMAGNVSIQLEVNSEEQHRKNAFVWMSAIQQAIEFAGVAEANEY